MYSKEERKILVHRFWTSFEHFCVEQRFLTGRRRMWMLHHTKVDHVQLKFDLQQNQVRVAIELSHRDEDERLRMFEKLESCKLLLEEGFESGLIWDFAFVKENGHEVCCIFTRLEGVDYHQTDNWPQIFSFMANNMFLLERNFIEIRDILIT